MVRAATHADDVVHLAETAEHLDNAAELLSHADQAAEIVGHAAEVVAAARETAETLGRADEVADAAHAADELLEASTWQEAEEVVGARLGVQKNITRYLEEGMSRRRIPDFATATPPYTPPLNCKMKPLWQPTSASRFTWW